MSELIQIITELISSVGFPIACCVIMFHSLDKERDAHKEESKGWQEVVANNTCALEKVSEKLADLAKYG